MSDEISNLKELKQLEAILIKTHGENYYPITQKKEREPVEFISTDCFSLDSVIGAGIPKGRIVEYSGAESSCKSTLALHTIAAYQRKGLVCALIDSENAFSSEYAKALGVDVDKLMILSQCLAAEDYLEALRQICKSPAVNLIVLDSVSALVPKRIIEGDVGDATMALMARFWSTHLPEIVPHLSKNKSTLLLVNQLRNTLAMYGAPKSSSGGNALKYYNSVRIELAKKGVIKVKGKEVGIEVQIKGVKNKVSSPFVTKQISVYFPNDDGTIAGIDVVSDIVDAALEAKVISQGGAYFTWQGFPLDKKGEPKVHSKDSVLQFFRDNPNSLPILKEDLLNNINNDNTSEDSQKEDSTDQQAA